MAVGEFAVIVHGNLSHAAGNAHREASGGVVAAQQHIGQGGSAFSAGVPEGEEGVGVFFGPVLIQRAAFYVHHHQRFAGGLEFFEELRLQAQQAQRAAVESFSGFHIGHGGLVHHGGAGIYILGLEITGRRAAHHHHGDIGAPGSLHGFGYVVGLGVPDGAALDVGDRRAGVLQAFQHSDHVLRGLRGGVVSQLVVLAVGVGADEGDARTGPERQDAVVLEEGHPFAGGLGGHFHVGGGAHLVGRSFRQVGVVEQARLELSPEHAAYGAVHIGDIQPARLYGFLEEGVAVGAQVHVHAGLEGQLSGFLAVGRHVVAGADAVYALEVAHHKAVKVPAVLQHACEERLVAGAGDAVYGVVAGHYAKCAGVDGCLEGGKHVFFQVSRADMGRAAVVAAFRNAVGYKVLEGGDNAFRRSAPHHGGGHLGGEVDVFSVSFFHAGPAGFSAQVNNRTVAYGAALCHQFLADDLAHLLDEFRVPGGAEAYGGGEDGGAYGHMPVGGFFGQNDGNAQAGGIYGVVLQRVIGLGRKLRVQARLQGFLRPGIGPESGPQHTAVLLLNEFPVCVRDLHGGIVIPGLTGNLLIHRPAQGAQELPQLLFQRHP